MSNDIKQQLRYFIDLPVDTVIVPLAWNNLCQAALARIEVLERISDRPSDLVETATRMMQGIISTDYSANRVYDFDGMADDAIAAAEALMSKLSQKGEG